MKTSIKIISSLFLSVAFFSCVKHEVIPKPIESVKLVPYFTGIINGTDVEYTDDVDGFNGETTEAQYIVAPPAFSKFVYFHEMNSNLINTTIKVGIGSLEWNAGALEKPSLTQFNTFFTERLTPVTLNYSLNAIDGFEVTFKDAFSNTWTSDETSVNTQTASFTSIENDSDNTGDYSKFTVNFSCYVYRSVSLIERDSILIENGILKAWFKR
jgi:hypothetical protein